MSEKGIVDIHKQDGEGRRPRWGAVSDNDIDVVAALLSMDGVDVNQAETSIGATPLYQASVRATPRS